MIDELLEEQASLYVLGVLTPEETLAFEAALSCQAELRHLVDALRNSRDALASALPQHTPPPALKQKILAQIEADENVRSLPATLAQPRGWAFLPWALAACLALVLALSAAQQMKLRQKIGDQARQLTGLNQLADALRYETQDLKQAVASLRTTNQLQNVRIAMLSSQLTDSPKAVAVSLWDDQQQQGVFVVQNLKPLPADQDYQLWVIDPKYPSPVSAGVFQVDAQGNVRLKFKTDKLIEVADKFAVTQEPKGGLATPTLKNLVLIGG